MLRIVSTYSHEVLLKRLAWALFVLLLSTLVCFQPTELIRAFLFHKFSFHPQNLGYKPYFRKWANSRPNKAEADVLLGAFEKLVPPLIDVVFNGIVRGVQQLIVV